MSNNAPEVQQCISKLTDFITNLCKKNNLYYRLSPNSNIAIQIDDFPKLKTLVHDNLPDNYEYTSVLYSGAKITDLTTTFISSSQLYMPEKYSGISIYIDPIISAPRRKTAKKQFENDLKYFFSLHRNAKGSIIYSVSLDQKIYARTGFYDTKKSYSEYQKKFKKLSAAEKNIIDTICMSTGRYYQYANSLEYQSRNHNKNTFTKRIRNFIRARKERRAK